MTPCTFQSNQPSDKIWGESQILIFLLRGGCYSNDLLGAFPTFSPVVLLPHSGRGWGHHLPLPCWPSPSSLQPPVHELFPDPTLHSRGALSLFFHCRVPATASVPAGSIRGDLCRARAPHLCKHELGGATSKGFARAPLPWMQTRRPVRTRRRKSVFVSFHWCGVVKK